EVSPLTLQHQKRAPHRRSRVQRTTVSGSVRTVRCTGNGPPPAHTRCAAPLTRQWVEKVAFDPNSVQSPPKTTRSWVATTPGTATTRRHDPAPRSGATTRRHDPAPRPGATIRRHDPAPRPGATTRSHDPAPRPVQHDPSGTPRP